MPIQTTYSNARENLASLLEQVTADREIVIISRRGFEDVALVTASELSSLLETAHLLRSPNNAQRLLKALHRAQAKTLKPLPLEKLRQGVGLDEED
jgi:antitoxin YefM